MTRPTRAQRDELTYCLVALRFSPADAAQQVADLGGPVPREGWHAAGRAACIRHLDRMGKAKKRSARKARTA
jgi:hypothetical protein